MSDKAKKSQLSAVDLANQAFEPNLMNLKLSNVEVAALKDDHIELDFVLPPGYHLNPDATINYKITQLTGEAVKVEADHKVGKVHSKGALRIPYQAGQAGSAADIKMNVDVHYCSEGDHGTCLVKTVRLAAHVKAVDRAGAWKVTCSITEKE